MTRPKIHIQVFRDYPEEGFPSMEVYANNLVSHLNKKQTAIKVTEHLSLSKLSSKLGYRNLKTRFIFRFLIAPLGAIFCQGDINHVIDQTYGHLLYFLNPNKTIITVHDLDVFRLKFVNWNGLRSKVLKLSYYFSVFAIKRAAYVITVSNDTKNDIVRYLKIDPRKIIVIPEGAARIFTPITDKKTLINIQTKYSLPDRFILHVGQCWEYKNLDQVFKTFALLSRQEKYQNLHLVKVGGDLTENHLRLIKQLKISDKFLKLPFVPTADLPGIYNLATCLFQPSFLEGFGLTVLEAMASGCPVVVSNTPALVELVGQSGQIIDPDDTHMAINIIEKIINNKAHRLKTSRYGLLRSRLFSWQRCANQTTKLYMNIYAKKN